MEPRYDCLVIGAGPAGSAAAYHLARSGHRVALLERAPRLGGKPCGGGVSPQVADWFGFDFGPVLERRVRHCRFTLRGAEPVDFQDDRDILWMVRRERFDTLLATQAQLQGAELLLSRPALGLDFQRGGWTVATAQGPLEARYLVAADGAMGRCAGWLGLRSGRPRVGAALELECPVAPAPEAPLYLDFGAIPSGYLWNFPKQAGQSLGIGTLDGARARDLRGGLARYAAGFGLDAAAGTLAAHPIHVWNGRRRLCTQQALLAGEAAAAVDPFTVEGIRPALRTGVWAAEAVHAALCGRASGLEGYARRVQELDGELRWARRLAAVFFRMPATAYRHAVMHPAGPRFMARLLRGDLAYPDAARRALAHLGAGF